MQENYTWWIIYKSHNFNFEQFKIKLKLKFVKRSENEM